MEKSKLAAFVPVEKFFTAFSKLTEDKEASLDACEFMTSGLLLFGLLLSIGLSDESNDNESLFLVCTLR